VGVLQQIRGQRSLSPVHVTATVIRKVARVIVRGGVSATQAGLGRTAVKVLHIYTYNWEPFGQPACIFSAIIPHCMDEHVQACHHTSHSSSFCCCRTWLPLISVLHYSVRRQLLYVSRQPCCQAGHSSEYHCCHCPPLHGAHCLHSPQEIDKQEDKEGSVSR